LFFGVLFGRKKAKDSFAANSKKEKAGKNPEGEEPGPPPPEVEDS
jgi:hypothetical protein